MVCHDGLRVCDACREETTGSSDPHKVAVGLVRTSAKTYNIAGRNVERSRASTMTKAPKMVRAFGSRLCCTILRCISLSGMDQGLERSRRGPLEQPRFLL